MPAEFWKAGCCTTSVGHCNCFIELPGKPSVPFFLRQLWLILGVKLLEINSNWFSRYVSYKTRFCLEYLEILDDFYGAFFEQTKISHPKIFVETSLFGKPKMKALGPYNLPPKAIKG